MNQCKIRSHATTAESYSMPLLRSIAPVALAGLLFNASIAYGQDPAGPTPAAQSVTTQTAVPTPDATILHANANLVLVDVVVTNHGNAVHGLDRSRFHIFENGHEQVINSFDEHKPSGMEATASAASSTAPAVQSAVLPPHTFSNVPRYPEAPSVSVLLLDGLNTPLTNQLDVRRQMLQYLDKIQPDTSLAIFTLASQLRQVAGFTTDVAELAKALKNPKAGAQPSVVLDPQGDQDLDTAVGNMATLGAPQKAVASMQQFQADLTAFQTDQRVRMTLNAMQQLARYLNAIPGRKNLIWFSGSFPLALDPDDSLQSPFAAMRNYSDDIRETAELLSAARVAVYPVDARGLMTMKSVDASYAPSTNLMSPGSGSTRRGNKRPGPSNMPSAAKDDAKFLKQTVAEQASMQQIADQTGGQAYVNTNGLQEAVASAVENGSSYYTISFVPGGTQFDGEFRKIQLRVDNADYKLAYRHGYYADPPDKPSDHMSGQTSLIVAATLHGAPPSTQIVFQARVLPASNPLLKDTNLPTGPAGEMTASLKAPPHRIIAEIKVDTHGLLFSSTPDGAIHSKVEFTLIAYDADGNRVNYLDTGLRFDIKAGQIAQAMDNGLPVHFPLDLPAGRFSLRIAVRDLDAGRAGSLEVPVTVAAN